VMDITLHDSGSQFEEDLALFSGNTQINRIARRQNNIIMNNSDGDGDDDDDDDDGGGGGDTLSVVDKCVLDKSIASDSETEASEEEFREMVNSDNIDNFGSDIMHVSSEYEISRKKNEQVLKRMKQKLNNNMLNIDKSDDIIENVIPKKISLERRKNKTETHLVSSTEGSEHTKRLFVHKRKLQKHKVTDKEKCGELEENHDKDNESNNVKLMENLKIKTKKQTHNSATIKCKGDERVCDVDGGDGGVSSVCEDVGDIMEEKENGEVEEYWEDIYGRTRDKQGNVIQVSIHSKH